MIFYQIRLNCLNCGHALLDNSPLARGTSLFGSMVLLAEESKKAVSHSEELPCKESAGCALLFKPSSEKPRIWLKEMSGSVGERLPLADLKRLTLHFGKAEAQEALFDSGDQGWCHTELFDAKTR